MFENFNADHNWRREWTGRKRGFPKNNWRANPSTMTTNLPWKASLPFAAFSFLQDQRRKDGDDFETDTVSSFQNTPELKRAKTYSALSFDRITFFNMANLFSLSRKPFGVCYCFREPIKTFFFDACQKTVKSQVLHFFPVLQTGRRHIINILLASFFRSVP